MSNEIVVYDDEQVERTVLAFLISDPKYFRPIDPELFSYAIPRKVQRVLNAFYQEWGQAPTVEALTNYASADMEVMLFLQDVRTLPTPNAGFRPAVQLLFDMYQRRKIMEEARTMVENIGHHQTEDIILRETIDRLSAVKHPLSFGEIERGEAADVAMDVWEEYLKHREHPELFNDGIRYGIYSLDQLTNGGTRKGHITLIYGDTSSGKTRLKSNMAYNMSLLGKRVMYVTIEDSMRTLVRLWLGRASLLKFTQIQNATLSAGLCEKFRQVCEDVHRERNLPYVVYWTGIATSADLRREIDLYISRFGYPPDVVFFDYSNEAYPIRKFNNTSERFNYLFSEYRQLTAQYQIPLITSLQESRTGKQKKKESEYGLDSIGQSHYVAPHCHLILYIKQLGDNGLDVYVQKNRYGARNKKISLFAMWDVGFVGERGRLVQHREMSEVLRVDAPPPEPDIVDLQSAAHAEHPVNAVNSSAEDASVDDQVGTVELNEEDYAPPET